MRLGHTAINGPPSTSDAGRAPNKRAPPPWSARRNPAVGDYLSGELRRGVAGRAARRAECSEMCRRSAAWGGK